MNIRMVLTSICTYYLRYTDKQRILVIANFNRNSRNIQVKLPPDLIKLLDLSGGAAILQIC